MVLKIESTRIGCERGCAAVVKEEKESTANLHEFSRMGAGEGMAGKRIGNGSADESFSRGIEFVLKINSTQFGTSRWLMADGRWRTAEG
jgi:hypothetical protein